MAETKADLIKQAKDLSIEHVSTKNTMAELREAIAVAAPKKHDKEALPAEEHEAKVAKSGKRSTKAIKETEAKVAKEEQKADEAEAVHVVKLAPKARSHAERAGKKYREAFAKVDRNKEYTLAEALELATKTSTTKFDASVEVHVRLSVDPRQADQNLRDSLVLPEGTGKKVRVAVFADVDDVAAAKKAGADIAGGDDFLQQLDKGTINFDVLIATPTMMAKLGKYARVLGPKGLMPNPKSGTVAKDVAKAVKEAKAGRIEFRVDSTGIVHVAVGKVSFGVDKLQNNAKTVFTSLRSAKPASVKGTYVKTIFVTTSMGPSIRVLNSEL